MRSIRRDLLLCSGMCAILFICAFGWGHPFLQSSSASSGAASWSETGVQAQQGPASSTIFTGTVVRYGEQFVLRDGSGQIYRLDDPQRATPFENKGVKVTGRLDAGGKVIHVEKIEAA